MGKKKYSHKNKTLQKYQQCNVVQEKNKKRETEGESKNINDIWKCQQQPNQLCWVSFRDENIWKSVVGITLMNCLYNIEKYEFLKLNDRS